MWCRLRATPRSARLQPAARREVRGARAQGLLADQAIVGILKAIRELMHPPVPKKRPIRFTANLDE
jgi:hypothetical protein